MPSSVFKIIEHTLDCQHIREYAHATAFSQEEVLKLAVKQYIPLDNPNPKPGDVTIIGAHANGFPKEMYEPLWEDLHAASKSHGFTIRGIWIADVAHQGASGVLNENVLGNDPSWLDHTRDLLHLTNTFRSQMPLPIIGIGHSFGANILVNLSLIHPRLLSTLILLDPVISQHSSSLPNSPNLVQQSTFRRDLWPTLTSATSSYQKSPFYQSWDPRVLSLWTQYGLRKTPTPLYPSKEDAGKITLTTTKHQECHTFLRPSWNGFSEDGKEVIDRELLPDLASDSRTRYPFYRPEPPNTLNRLPNVRPSTLYIFGGKSDLSPEEQREIKLKATGTGAGGSGGREKGRVKGVVLENAGHLVAMEDVKGCVDAAVPWIEGEAKRWERERREFEEWTKKSWEEKTMLSEEWKRRIGGPPKSVKSKI